MKLIFSRVGVAAFFVVAAGCSDPNPTSGDQNGQPQAPDVGYSHDSVTGAGDSSVPLNETSSPDADGPANFCDGVADGDWCDGQSLVTCTAEQLVTSKQCELGCIVTPQGAPDVCGVALEPLFCEDKGDGGWCKGSAVVTCAGGVAVGQLPCPVGCIEQPPVNHGACAAEDTFCWGKADGTWCGGEALITCAAGEFVVSVPCPAGCLQTADAANECADPPVVDFCTGHPDGQFCASGTLLVTCAASAQVTEQVCELGCQPSPPGELDACAQAPNPGFCAGKADNAWCDGDKLTTCTGGVAVGQVTCLSGCISNGPGQPDHCAPAGAETFCNGKPDGAWCKGELLLTCSGGEQVSENACPEGCTVNPPGVADECSAGGVESKADFCQGKQNGLWCLGDALVTCLNDLVASETACSGGCLANPPGIADECGDTAFCTPVPSMSSPSPPATSCSYMDWKLSPDGWYLVSQFGTTNDPSTLGNSTTCGFLQGHYNAKGCVWDQGSGSCQPGPFAIDWTQGHVDYEYEAVLSAVDAFKNGNVPYPKYFYVAGAQRFNCGTTLRVSNPKTGKCVVAYVEDGGPGAKYEGASYGGRRILDSSPALIQYLGVDKLGWKSSTLLYVEWGLPGDVPGQACSPCGSSPAKAENAGPKSPWDVLHMVPSCSDGGTASCPDGSGLYCGGSVGLDPGTLYNCVDGNFTPHEACAEGCQTNPPGTSDSCKGGAGPDSCPSGNGLYCGGPIGMDANTLYYCADGVYSESKSCAEGCQENPPGTSDDCKSGGGTPTPGKLVMCEPFSPKQPVTCAFGCYPGHKGSDYSAGNGTPIYAPISGQVTKVSNSVKGQTCSPNFGSYVKIAQGKFEVILAHMNPDIKVSELATIEAGTHVGNVSNTGYTLTYKGGDWVCQQGGGYHLHLEVRKSGAAFDPFSSSDVQWSSSCEGTGAIEPSAFCTGKANGLWCDGKSLVNCQNGFLTSSETCPAGCQSNPPGTADECAGGGGTECPSGNGAYCGGSVGKDSNTLYQCTNGGYSVIEVCKSGCQIAAPGTSDKCKAESPASCPSGNGAYCGGSVGKDSNTLYQCTNGSYSTIEVCKNGCQIAAPGTSDKCKADAPASCPSGNGAYCGGSVGKDSSTLYQCTNGSYSTIEVCKNGCEIAAPGTSDKCKADAPASCPSGNGAYCGSSVGKDSNTLYQCTNGSYGIIEVCKNGCEIAAPGTSDKCKADTPSGCPSGNGAYCGGPVGKDSKTLYQCQSGSYSFKAWCAAGCYVAPAGTADKCNSGSCPSGNGAYCGQTAGLSSSTLYTCQNGTWTIKQQCGGTCFVAPPGQPDKCP